MHSGKYAFDPVWIPGLDQGFPTPFTLSSVTTVTSSEIENPEELILQSNELENSVSQLTNEYATRSWRYSSVDGLDGN